MMRGALLLASTLALALSACAPPPRQQQEQFSQVPPPPAAPGGCNAEGAQFAVGQPYGEALADQVRRRSGATVLRTIRPGQIVTMEFSSERVTLDLDGGGRVTRVRCG
ncbi:hypothetical protein FN976_22320 [Caenimonas sedimenti]|uniref:Proteinase inhibitor I78 n=1 Tax=Caenimonas sedimenti TaxID=2596921 RepID=A0A562ZJG8_9BURK|nr:I78 family peptidase inhibitor [Caenimonas sedimenti]TWO68729.1 hypothetical protein FN976_22320 [Caenimonas sedimenti]